MAVRNLNVEIGGASGLTNSEYIGKADPYVILSIGKTQRKSKVAQDQATTPSWNEKFTLPVADTDVELVIQILNDNTMAKDDELGRVVVPLSEIHGSHSASTFGLQWKGKPQGELKMNLSFEGEDDHESKGLVEKIQEFFVGDKDETSEGKHKEHHEEEKEEGHEDKGLKKKVEEKTEELKEEAEEKYEESEEKVEKKKKGKESKKEKKSAESGDECSSSSSDSESDKDDH